MRTGADRTGPVEREAGRRDRVAPGGGPPGSLRAGGLRFALGQLGGMALGFGGSMLLVRIADPPAVASYLLLQRGIAAVAVILQVGLVPAVIRFAPLSRGVGGASAMRLLRRRILGIQLGIWVVFVPLAALLWSPIVRRLDAPELVHATPYLVSAAVLISLNAVLDAYIRSARMYAASALLSHVLVRGLVAGAFLTLFLAFGGEQPWPVLALIFTAAQLAATLGYVAVFGRSRRRDESAGRAAQNPPPVRTILGATSAMGLQGAVAALLVSSDLWILSWSRPHREVAVYGVMLSLVQTLGMIQTVANLVIPQEFAVLKGEGRVRELEWLVRTAATAVAVISIGALLGLVVAGKPLIHLLFGPEYAAGWSVLLILGFGRSWDAVSGSAGFLLQMTGHHMALLVVTIAAAVLNIGASVLLAPRLGGLGVALATTVTLVLLNLVRVRLARLRLGVRTFAFLRPADWLRVVRQLMDLRALMGAGRL